MGFLGELQFYHWQISLSHKLAPLFISLLFWEFFTKTLADGFSLEFEWQQVSSGLLDSSRYSSRSQQCCRLDGLYISSILWRLYQELHLQVILLSISYPTIFFQFLRMVFIIIFLFVFFQFYSVVCRDSKVHNSVRTLFCWLSLCMVDWPGLDDRFVSQNPIKYCTSHLLGWILCCAYVFMVKFKFLAQFPVDDLAHPALSSLILFLC